MKDCEKAFGGILEWMIVIIWLVMKCLQIMLGSVECTIPQSIYQNWCLSSVFASDKEKAFFKKEFASAQEEIERHKKVLSDAKKVGISTLFVPKLALLTNILSGQETEIGNSQTRFDCRIFSLGEGLLIITRL